MRHITHKPHWALVKGIRWPREEKKGSFLYGGPQLSRQNQKPHGKNKIPHGKTKNLTAKPNTSQQKQNSFGFAVSICFCREVFGFCCEVFGFAVKYLVFPVKYLVLPWGFRFCREVFCFCRGVFGFAVRYFVFAMRFLVLPWQFWATVPFTFLGCEPRVSRLDLPGRCFTD